MRVTIVDLNSPTGHVALDESLISAFSMCSDIKIRAFASGEMVHRFRADGTGGVEILPYSGVQFRGRVKSRIAGLACAGWLRHTGAVMGSDICMLTSYDTITLPLVLTQICVPRILVIDHENLDELGSTLKLGALRITQRKVEHVVFEQYMADYVRSLLPDTIVHVIPHPVASDLVTQENSERLPQRGLVALFAPSYSNSEEIIADLLDAEVQRGALREAGVRLVAHSQDRVFDDGYLKVYTEHLSRDSYVTLFRESDFIFMPYPESFRYRMSGVMSDCIAARKPFIATPDPVFQTYVEKFPGIGYIVENVADLMVILKELRTQPTTSGQGPEGRADSFARAQEEHSLQALVKSVHQLVESAS